jgi:hypothetical protein
MKYGKMYPRHVRPPHCAAEAALAARRGKRKVKETL